LFKKSFERSEEAAKTNLLKQAKIIKGNINWKKVRIIEGIRFLDF